MTEKIVCQLNEDGYFLGTTVADESPLEPGVYHLPYGTIDVEVPVVPEGKLAKWVEDKFVFEDIPVPVVEETPELIPLPEIEPLDALSKLKAFLQANPDVKQLLDGA